MNNVLSDSYHHKWLFWGYGKMWLETILNIHLSSSEELPCDLSFTPSYSYTSLYCPKTAPQQLHCRRDKAAARLTSSASEMSPSDRNHYPQHS